MLEIILGAIIALAGAALTAWAIDRANKKELDDARKPYRDKVEK